MSPQEQRMSALESANRVRAARAVWKRDLAEDRVLILKALCDPPEWLLTARVTEILQAIPKFGPVKVRKVLSRSEVPVSARVGELTERQRVLLLRDLRGRL